ncbi:MAG: hypothetical protein Q4D07_08535 [Selenomonadaceae bacterium]|nr:hypothetical protein [Selenomonadaceae bacterium]
MRRTGERGFLLTETLVLAFIVMAAAVAYGVFSIAYRSAASGRETICADYLAREELAYLEAGNFSGSVGWLGPAGENRQNEIDYTVTAEVTDASAGTKRAEIAVTWRRRDGRLGERRLVRLLEAP